MTVRNFASILPDDILNNNFSNLYEDYVNITIPLLTGILLGDRGSNETYHLSPEIFPREINMVDISADGSRSDLSFSSSEISNHTWRVFSFVILWYGKNTRAS